MTVYAPLPHLKIAELRLAEAVAQHIPELGLNRSSLEAGARHLGFSEGMRDLTAPNGAADIAAVLWRRDDSILHSDDLEIALRSMKIRDKIAYLVNLRVDSAAVEEPLLQHLMGFFALPTHAALYHRLLWDTAGMIWRLAGDTALDENHYSKRFLVSGIVTSALIMRMSQGREAQQAQVARNIARVMSFESFKAKLPFKPEKALQDLAHVLGRLRYGSTVVTPQNPIAS